MSYKDEIFSLSIEKLKELYGKTPETVKDLISQLADVEWLNTLDSDKVNNIIIRLAIIAQSKEFSEIKDFITTVEKCSIIPQSLSEEHCITLFTHAYLLFKNHMISGFKHLTTGPNPRDPENEKEEILYCLATSIQGSQKIPATIINQLLFEVDLDVKTPNYKDDILNIVCGSGNIEYIRCILIRVINEKTRTSVFDYIQDRWWLHRNKCSTKFVEDLENVFKDLDLPFSVTLQGQYSKKCGILLECNTVRILEICITYLPDNHRVHILQKRAFRILCNFLDGDLDEFKKGIEIFEKQGVDMEKVFTERCKEKGMCLLDKVCLDYTVEKVSYVISKMSDELKAKVFKYQNYGMRTPLQHARYYTREDSPKEITVENEMKRLCLL